MRSNRREILLAALNDSDSGVRQAAAESLDLFERYQGLSSLEQVLVSGSRQQRVAAVYVLESLNCAAANTLLMMALNDGDDDVRAVAIQIAGSRRLPEALPVLVQCLKAADVSVAVYAANALGQYNDERLVAYLQAICRQADTELLCASLAALGQLGFIQAQDCVCGYIDDLRAEVRMAAVRALGLLHQS
ncbi:MAG: hypothetical protein B6I37_01860 [Desulfobacteraceae bacterium 4572_35.2]|nr:MAG: hypothetical protein B6I37_01860 [Desulfobacteraceae bacterium 4572_35.2]